MRTPDVISIGEAIVDLVSVRPTRDLSSAEHFVKVAGGAPANVAVGLSRLGIRSAFLGKVGRDSFGRFLKRELRRNGVQTQWIVDDPDHKTRLAFVAVTKNGDRDFEFWENDPADQHLKKAEIDLDTVCRSSIINVGPFLLLNAETRAAAFAVAEHAKGNKRSVCFDPNIRMSLWDDRMEAIQQYRDMIRYATILRLNEDEAVFLTKTSELTKAVKKLLLMGPEMVVVTKDKRGCMFGTKECSGIVKGFPVKAIDTTGCGDGFLAGLLAGIIRAKKQAADLSQVECSAICRTANAAGAIVATKRGAIAAMPTQKQLDQFQRRYQ